MISCDSSSIVALSANCLLWLMKYFPDKFFVPGSVMSESVETPLERKKYRFEAAKTLSAVRKGWITVMENEKIAKEAEGILSLSNNIFSRHGEHIKILHMGEAQALALSLLSEEDTVMIDEKATRLLLENPELLKSTLEGRLSQKGPDKNNDVAIEFNKEVYSKLMDKLKNIEIIRSAEFVVVAYERGYLKEGYPNFSNDELRDVLLSGILYALKSSGCAISDKEIKDIIAIEKASF